MVIREDEGHVAVLRLAHGKVSALDAVFCETLIKELNAISAGTARSLVITGTGSVFSAGVDLFQILEGGPEYGRRFLSLMKDLFQTVLTFPKPAVAAVNGHAIAGGCILAAACDHRIMARGDGRIGVPELAVGVPFPSLPFEIVGARVGQAVFRDLVYTARTMLADEALPLGLIDEVAEPDALMARARTKAEQLSAIPPRTFALTKRTFTAPLLERVRAASHLNAEAEEAWQDPDVRARIREYLQQTVRKSK